MVLSQLENSRKVVGAKQTKRALKDGKAARVFLARNADPALTEPLLALCRERGVGADCSLTMQQLGRACGIAVPASAVAIVAQ